MTNPFEEEAGAAKDAAKDAVEENVEQADALTRSGGDVEVGPDQSGGDVEFSGGDVEFGDDGDEAGTDSGGDVESEPRDLA
ncbi:hypothetical protein [Kribbella sp. NPDC051620]|uniref:hypothetical protein n=1 Tax=Kribbella sp. NPDC051620 TaxID=3364120 RepID=UPI0037B09FED